MTLSPDKLREFKRLYGTTKDARLADDFGLSMSQVKRLAIQLALGKDKRVFPIEKMPRWTHEQVTLLTELYPMTPNEEIARQLGRTVKSVVAKAHNLKLRKDPERLRQMGQQNVKLRRDRQ